MDKLLILLKILPLEIVRIINDYYFVRRFYCSHFEFEIGMNGTIKTLHYNHFKFATDDRDDVTPCWKISKKIRKYKSRKF